MSNLRKREPTAVRFITVHQVYMSSHEDRAKAMPNTQEKCFLVKQSSIFNEDRVNIFY